MYVAFVYLFVLYATVFAIARMFTGTGRAHSITFFCFATLFLLLLAAATGLLVQFVVGDHSYFKEEVGPALGFEANLIMSYYWSWQSSHKNMASLFLLPYVALAALIWCWFILITQHLTIPLFITHLAAAYIIIVIYWSLGLNSKLADPEFGWKSNKK